MHGWLTAALALALAGCSGGPTRARRDNTTVTVEIEGEPRDAIAGGEGANLEDPPPPDPAKPYLDYLKRAHPPLRDAWRTFLDDCRLRLPADHALNRASLAVAVDIDLDRGGLVRSVRVAESSGTAEFDQVAVEIVGDVGALATPPPEVISDDGKVHLRWLFARDRRQAGVATAELRRDEWPPKRAVPRLIASGELAEAASRVAKAAQGVDAESAMERELLIGLLDQVAAAVIRRALASDDVEIQRQGVAAAAGARLNTSSGELRRIAVHSVDLSLRRDALRALGAVGDRGAVAILVDAMTGKAKAGSEAMVAAAESLAELDEAGRVETVAAGWLASKDAAQRANALMITGRVPVARAVPDLSSLLLAEGARAERLAAAAALGRAAAARIKDAATALVTGMDSSDAPIRAACVQGIAVAAASGVRSRAGFWKIVPLTRDRDERVRAASFLALARLDTARFVKELSRNRKESSPAVLAAIAEGLVAVQGPAARKQLVQLVSSEDAGVRRRAAQSLSAIGDAAARQVLATLTADSDLEIRVLAIAALTERDALSPFVDAELPRIRAVAMSRSIKVQGRASSLAEVARRLVEVAERPDEGSRVAAAWLAPGWLPP